MLLLLLSLLGSIYKDDWSGFPYNNNNNNNNNNNDDDDDDADADDDK